MKLKNFNELMTLPNNNKVNSFKLLIESNSISEMPKLDYSYEKEITLDKAIKDLVNTDPSHANNFDYIDMSNLFRKFPTVITAKLKSRLDR